MTAKDPFIHTMATKVSTTEKMIQVSLQGQGMSRSISFGVENYFQDSRRSTYACTTFETFDLHKLAKRYEGLNDVGTWILVTLFNPRASDLRLGSPTTAIVYGSKRNHDFDVHVNEEPFRENFARRNFVSLPIPAFEYRESLNNADFRVKVALTAISLLLT